MLALLSRRKRFARPGPEDASPTRGSASVAPGAEVSFGSRLPSRGSVCLAMIGEGYAPFDAGGGKPDREPGAFSQPSGRRN